MKTPYLCKFEQHEPYMDWFVEINYGNASGHTESLHIYKIILTSKTKKKINSLKASKSNWQLSRLTY